ncbi:ferredoxin-thioredoxin reductase catalytic domain-containing protein [Spirochaeta thermophila]|uniref:ferredoxin:thioredoxin reductase n=1 Tax=Winmispira thermophila (strain ATCC 49972 / DSM 6192 / RI 19.B1) TaxID=665571 RepID=E0RQW7_WINT6|nr:ferredoxin-thioredoxin reductase catalytic domain-containing protein [Spirochaeta thermophila]ADN03023.1 hypothetical protein STHERM_c20920 [Spirochaeta thermophila DSM 6192]
MSGIEEARRFVERAARKRGWAINPDERFVSFLVEGLARQRDRHGYYLCPCRESWEDREKDRDVVCPCVYAEADIAEYGQCFCGLFFSREAAREGREAGSIPERRPPERCP